MKRDRAYGFGKQVDMPFDEAVQRLRTTLREQQFSLMSEIDMAERFKEEMNLEFRRYLILGACNPHVAYKALTTDIDLGVLFPCNVVVYEENPGVSVIMAVDPVDVFVTDNPSLRHLLQQIRQRLQTAIDKV